MGKFRKHGEVSERFKVTTSKVVVGVTPPRVRIPSSPDLLAQHQLSFCFEGMRTTRQSLVRFERESAESGGLAVSKRSL